MMEQTSQPSEPAARTGEPKLADQVYEKILTSIITGDFPAGEKLPTEMELCSRYGISRPILRQALRQLKADELVVSRQGSGSFVKRRPDGVVLNFAPVGSIADIQRTFEFRAAIEAEAAALAAERHDQKDLERIRAALAALDECVRTGQVGGAADEEFHMAVCSASGNHYFENARTSMKAQIVLAMTLNRQLSLASPEQRLAKVQTEHVRIFKAITDRNAPAAYSAMRDHIESARRRIFDGGVPVAKDWAGANSQR
ncbi:FadR family transcriptional regulator [Devosia sp. BSSL-BM10]|jgi:GntR family transcriptional regulator, transcriptional repressor for pyruvate dehydrogenase complex|uniref:FadR family transcriptional regulator n=2 Tax=Devosia TaxID=46913 RepID=A0A942EB70_9HYPH|nr:FadR/GntR family transcriptional regulator [Devosia litorisediminis]MBS3848700.1 FadR family transcriptional regulator [Devosia litorisediminis]|tara:strand:+ start:7645 stop:8412 length:768 start_codon:yes stop_codon:yes gene_type:complete